MGPTAIPDQKSRLKRNKCKLCDYRADSKARVGQHMRMHSDKTPFVCSFSGCSFRSKYPQSLEEHESRHDRVRSSRDKCSICAKGFCMPYQLQRHFRIHTQEKLKKCPECDFKAVNCTGLISHKKKVHGIGKIGHKTPKYKEAESANTRAEFKEQQLEDGLKLYKCLFPGCDYKTKSRQCIMTHCRTVHNPSYKLVCSFTDCGRQFKILTSFKRHIKCHKQRDHRCPLCSKKFFNPQDLRRHVRTHTGEKAYQCPFCEYDSVENCNIYRHIHQRHPNNWTPGLSVERRINSETNTVSRLFKCEFCESTAGSEISLLKHSVSHRRLTVNIARLCHRCHYAKGTHVHNDFEVPHGHNFNNNIQSINELDPVVILKRILLTFVP